MTANIRQATTVEPKIIVAQTVATTSSSAVYTVPSSTSVKVVTATVCNSNVNVSSGCYISLRKSGSGTPWRIANIDLGPLESSVVTEMVGVVMGPGDGISIAGFDTTNVELVVSAVVSS